MFKTLFCLNIIFAKNKIEKCTLKFISFDQGSIKIYKLPLPKDIDDHTIMGFDPQFGMFQVLFIEQKVCAFKQYNKVKY